MQTKNVPLHKNNSQSGGLHWCVQKEERRSLERLCGRRCERVPAKARRNEPLRARDLSTFSGQRDGRVRGERRRSKGNVCVSSRMAPGDEARFSNRPNPDRNCEGSRLQNEEKKRTVDLCPRQAEPRRNPSLAAALLTGPVKVANLCLAALVRTEELASDRPVKQRVHPAHLVEQFQSEAPRSWLSVCAVLGRVRPQERRDGPAR